MQSYTINHFYSYINTASSVLRSYNGQTPFAHFIKDYFSRHKKFGSRDRKLIMQFCYSYFRLGKSFFQLPVEQKILKGLQYTDGVWNDDWLTVIQEDALPSGKPDNIFSFKEALSETIDADAFEQSHLVQPDLFLRIRPGHEKIVTDKIRATGLAFHIEDNTVRLPNSFKANNVIELNKEAVVQDMNSQNIGRLLNVFKSVTANRSETVAVWDCCAASGGKSILVKDILPCADLVVSDLRPSILANLKNRFKEAGIKAYKAFVADATKAKPGILFDLVIADVPCSGSGTWARTPEQLLFFEEKKIADYVKLQSSIVANVATYIKPGGCLLYITCSVFKKENEEQVRLLQENGLELIEQHVFKGYENRADTMFGALLRKREPVQI